jgi:hypothetical protein
VIHFLFLPLLFHSHPFLFISIVDSLIAFRSCSGGFTPAQVPSPPFLSWLFDRPCNLLSTPCRGITFRKERERERPFFLGFCSCLWSWSACLLPSAFATTESCFW